VQLQNDEHLLIRLFQKSLTGPALRWFTSLDLTSIQTWDQLAKAFVDQYSFNLDIAPTRADLEALTQNPSESFKDFVRRWRSLVAQVPSRPSLEESIDLIIQKTHPSLEALLSFQTFTSFTDLVQIGTLIEARLQKGNCPLLTDKGQPSQSNAYPYENSNSDIPVVANLSAFSQRER
jgi:hypothetical protein